MLEFAGYLPFEGDLRRIEGAVVEGFLRNTSNSEVFPMMSFNFNYGPDRSQCRMNFPDPVKGKVHVTGRLDNPI